MVLFVLLLIVLLGFAAFVASVARYSQEAWVFSVGFLKWGATFKAYPHEVILICVAASSIVTALFSIGFSARRGRAEVEELRRRWREAERRAKEAEERAEELRRRAEELEAELRRLKAAKEGQGEGSEEQ